MKLRASPGSEFGQGVDLLWPFYADTSRFNEAGGSAPYQIDERVQPDRSVP